MEVNISATIKLDRTEVEQAIRDYVLKKKKVKCTDIKFTDGGVDNESINVHAVVMTVHEDDVSKITE
jgi:hypothetical protein